ncbi:hypothetical protein ES703_125785 [subsurface metagenome]
MIFRFDFARLELFQRESLRKILDVIQSENVGEIVVCAVELPYKFLVLADNTVELLWGLDCEKRACPVRLNRNPNPNRSSSSRNRNRNRIRNRSHRIPVKAAHFVQDRRLQL